MALLHPVCYELAAGATSDAGLAGLSAGSATVGAALGLSSELALLEVSCAKENSLNDMQYAFHL